MATCKPSSAFKLLLDVSKTPTAKPAAAAAGGGGGGGKGKAKGGAGTVGKFDEPPDQPEPNIAVSCHGLSYPQIILG